MRGPALLKEPAVGTRRWAFYDNAEHCCPGCWLSPGFVSVPRYLPNSRPAVRRASLGAASTASVLDATLAGMAPGGARRRASGAISRAGDKVIGSSGPAWRKTMVWLRALLGCAAPSARRQPPRPRRRPPGHAWPAAERYPVGAPAEALQPRVWSSSAPSLSL